MRRTTLGLVVGAFVLGGGVGAAAEGTGQEAPKRRCERYVRTELFFGSLQRGGGEVTADEFDRFLDREITPRFPDGLTVLTGAGRYRDREGRMLQERTQLVILLYPGASKRPSDGRIEEIRSAYVRQFDQDSVLRADDPHPVCVAF
jgi:Protein of unknown function (DUF3574)